jgi:elongation factor 2
MGRREDMMKKALGLMNKPDQIRNIGIAAHIDHGKTTLSDNLIAGAGMMSEELAGKQLVLDYDQQEQARGITINSASVSMVHTVEGQDYLINLIDTPGHVDFGGDVTRAMRAVDGAMIVVCAVEGVMPQTETVVRQALREKVRPTLFINKVDRMINELQVTPEQMQAQFVKIILDVNRLIAKMVPKEFKGIWKVAVEDGSVAFGSAYHNWATSIPYMQRSNISFKDIYDHLNEGRQKELAKKSPIHEILLDMVVHHTPSAVEAQKYRIPHIWNGDLDSKVGKAMMTTSEDGPLTMMITKIIIDPHAGEVATGRVFSGHIERGQTVHVLGMPGSNRVQQVGFFFGADREAIEKVSAGNIAAVTGLKSAIAGSTIATDPEMDPFEKIVHVSEPVVTVAIEAKHMKDLPKLVEVLRQVAKADPSLQVTINQETGEHLLSGMGELHLEITEFRIVNEKGVDIKSSQPIVVYRESVGGHSGKAFEGKSPNKHNRFYFVVEPLAENIIQAIKNGDIQSDSKIKDAKALMKDLQDLGMEKDEAKGVYYIHGTNMFINATKGIQYLHEVKELLIDAFNEAMSAGPLSREPVMGVKVSLMDAKLHEDAIHRGPAQVIPAARNGIFGAMMWAKTTLREPKQKVYIDIPQDIMGSVTRELQSRRAEIIDMTQENDMTKIISKAPVSELFGFASAIRSVTGGKALWNTESAGFEILPREFLDKVVHEIRTRKGLKPEPPTADYFSA